MAFDRFPAREAVLTAGLGAAADPRAIAARDAQERAALRQKKIEQQHSPLYEPQERIRLWEQLHALKLPLDPNHKLVRLIASQTHLSVRQVQDEQERRARPIPPAPAT